MVPNEKLSFIREISHFMPEEILKRWEFVLEYSGQISVREKQQKEIGETPATLENFKNSMPVHYLSSKTAWDNLVEIRGENVNLLYWAFPETKETVPPTYENRRWFKVNSAPPTEIREISDFLKNIETIVPTSILDRWEFTQNMEGSLLLRQRQPKVQSKHNFGTRIIPFSCLSSKEYWEKIIDAYGEDIDLKVFGYGPEIFDDKTKTFHMNTSCSFEQKKDFIIEYKEILPKAIIQRYSFTLEGEGTYSRILIKEKEEVKQTAETKVETQQTTEEKMEQFKFSDKEFYIVDEEKNTDVYATYRFSTLDLALDQAKALANDAGPGIKIGIYKVNKISAIELKAPEFNITKFAEDDTKPAEPTVAETPTNSNSQALPESQVQAA